MPGFDRSRIVGKSAEELEEFTCGICRGLFDQPMVTSCCRQAYCDSCVKEWLKGQNTCPNDRKPLTSDGLTEAPRFVFNLIDKMQIKCYFNAKGCPSVHTISEDSDHMNVCPFAECKDCGKWDPESDHNCLSYLLERNQKLTELNQKWKTKCTELNGKINDLMSAEETAKEMNEKLKTDLELKGKELEELRQTFAKDKNQVWQLKGKISKLKVDMEFVANQENKCKLEMASLQRRNVELQRKANQYKSALLINVINEAKGKSGSVVHNVDNVSNYWNKTLIEICKDAINQFDSAKQTITDFINAIEVKIGKFPNLAPNRNVYIHANGVQANGWPSTSYVVSFHNLQIIITPEYVLNLNNEFNSNSIW